MVDDEDDFGYDLSADDEEALLQLASSMTPAPAHAHAHAHAHDHACAPHHVLVPHASPPSAARRLQDPAGLLVPRAVIPGAFPPDEPHPLRLPRDDLAEWAARAAAAAADDGIRYPNLSAALRSLEQEKSKAVPGRSAGDAEAPRPKQRQAQKREQQELDTAVDSGAEDGRSPLERFRQFPQKVLSVSDLTAGAWCELKYWYTLTKLPGGRAIRTPAMRQGSKVHQRLEEEVHTTVRIEITTKEDGFGLRLWNLVQGLRTLRDTGLTRELEVWGVVDGNLVNGVVDSVSSVHPNPDFEEQLFHEGSLVGSQPGSTERYYPGPSADHTKRYYLGDVKTRGSHAPVSNATFRPAKIQLLLYHRFLSEMAAGRLDYFKVIERYGLDAHARFSDYFLSQVGELHDEIFFDSSTTTASAPEATSSSTVLPPDQHPLPAGAASPSGFPDLLRYGTLADLVPLVEEEVRQTFPQGAASLGPILSVQYVHRVDEREISSHDFPVSAQSLTAYLDNYMRWWRGERKAAGVDIEEAFKCGSCDFAADCSWRRDMDEARVAKARRRMGG